MFKNLAHLVVKINTYSMEFFVRIYDIILSDVLRYGKRRQLAEFEAIGDRFHRVINAEFSETPFLVLNIYFE